MDDTIIKTAQNSRQKFCLIKTDEGFGIKYGVGGNQEGWITYGSENLGTEMIKIWKTEKGAMKAWDKKVIEHELIEIA